MCRIERAIVLTSGVREFSGDPRYALAGAPLI